MGSHTGETKMKITIIAQNPFSCLYVTSPMVPQEGAQYIALLWKRGTFIFFHHIKLRWLISNCRGPESSRRLRLPDFKISRHIKMARLAISTQGHSAAVPVTPSRIEPKTFWLIAKRGNQLYH